MNIAGFLIPAQLSQLAAEPRPVPEKKTMAELKSAYRAAHPRLTPQQALASGAEAAPPSDDPRASHHVSKLHTEIKINGKVIARTYDGGAVEIASEYGFLSDELDFGRDSGAGPDLAADRAKRIVAALARYGAVSSDAGPAELNAAKLAGKPILETMLAETAQTQQQWLDDALAKGEIEPGTLWSRSA